MPKTKICSKCGKELLVTEEYFYIRKDSKDGFRNDCKECYKKYYRRIGKKRYYEKNNKIKKERKYQNRKWLKHQYIDLNKTAREISKQCKCNENTIGIWLRKFKIITEKEGYICEMCGNPFIPHKKSVTTQKYCNRNCTRKHYYSTRRGSRSRKNSKLKREYGITIEEYDKIVRIQKKRCKICGSEVEILYIDHNHKTDEIRGLLCHNCNISLGLLKDNPMILYNCIKYLRREL